MRRRELQVFSLSFLDLISGALGAVIILYVSVPKAQIKKNQETSPVEVMTSTSNTEELEKKISDLQREVAKTRLENEELKSQINEQETEVNEIKEPLVQSDYDVGFRFKGKNIIFLLDTSLSMYEEDRIGQVKAGLKMLLTSMPPIYNVDVVIFPNAQTSPYRSLWGNMKKLDKINKDHLFEFIYSIRPNGGTPTREALTYIFQNYPNLTDIVILSDGEPSLHNSPVKDDIYDILSQVTRLNQSKVQINSIGVGEEAMRDRLGAPYQFLKLLSEQNGGFFVEF